MTNRQSLADNNTKCNQNDKPQNVEPAKHPRTYFSGINISRVGIAALYILPALALALFFAGDLDILSLGDDTARSLGLRVRTARSLQLILASV